MLRTQQIRTEERQRTECQQRPDEVFALLGFVRGPGHRQHGGDSGHVGHRAQPADGDDVSCGCLFDDARQPHDETVHADAPQRVNTAQLNHHRAGEGLAVIAYLRHAFLFVGQGGGQLGFFLLRQPVDLLGLVTRHAPPDEGPQHGRGAFNDKHFAPAPGLNQVARHHRHPQHCDRVAQHQKSVGP